MPARRVTAQANAVWDSRTGVLRVLSPHEIPIRAGDVLAMDGDGAFPEAVLDIPHRLAPVYAERIVRLPRPPAEQSAETPRTEAPRDRKRR